MLVPRYFAPAIVGAAMLVAAPVYAEAYLEVTASPQKIQMGETFTLRINLVQSSDNLTQDFAVPNLSLPDLAGVEVLNYRTQNYRVQMNQQKKLNTEALYVLKPTRTGRIEIPALEQPYTDNGKPSVLRSKATTIEVVKDLLVTPKNNSQLPSTTPPTPAQTPKPNATTIEPFLQKEGFLESGPDTHGLYRTILQGFMLLFILAMGIAMGVWWRRGAQNTPKENMQAAPPVVIVPPKVRTFKKSYRQLEQGVAGEDILNTFRQEMIAYLLSKEFLLEKSSVEAMSNHEILAELQKSLVPLSFFEACQALLKDYDALRYQGTPPALENVQKLLENAEQVFKKIQ